jgi:outer membrane autotransporter protein
VKRTVRILACGAVAAFVGLSDPAAAQQLLLDQVPGASGFQQRIGGSVQTTCVGLGAVAPQLNAAQQDLFLRCTEMVVNADNIQGFPTPGPTLGLDAAGLNDALLQVSDYASGAVGLNQTQSAFVQAANIQSRFLALREGDTGISIAGLQVPQNDEHGFPAPVSAFRQDAASGDAAALPAGLGVFLTGKGNWGDFDGTSEQLGFDYGGGGVTGGVDYRFTEQLVAGLAFGWVGSRADFDGSGGHLDQDAFIPSIYASFTDGGFYADGIFSYSYNTFDLERRIRYAFINRTATGDTDANEYSFSLGAGYEFDLKEVAEGLTAGPRVRFDYLNEQIDGFGESGANGLNLTYLDYRIESAVSVVGAEAAYAISTSFGVLTPQIRADWNHEFADAPARVKARFTNDPNNIVFYARPARLNRDFARLGAGIVGTFAHGISAFLDYEVILGLNHVEANVVNLGGRYEF